MRHISEITKNYLDRFEDNRRLTEKILSNLDHLTKKVYSIQRTPNKWQIVASRDEKIIDGAGEDLVSATLDFVFNYYGR